ncbi:ABC transporter substrate-binding protein [Demequina sp. NBRC 110056]|uniref:ABC transporter substrate-binding protein n=1 Tax=Demequina sp. NBRC 110056 TaxID=1570345 RepID=UPI00135630F5|nr:ABC transporter substrate-binding protein [Demequina sp. NBRC 110056]
MKWTRSRTASALAIGAASAMLLTACSSGDGETEEPTDAPTAEESEAPEEKEPVTLNVSYWGTFGLEALETQYESENPHVDIVLDSGEYGAQHDKLTQALIAGSGASEVSAIDEGYMAGFLAQQENFTNLLDLGAGKYEENYLDWKWGQASSADGSYLIGLGSDVGGLAMCYRHDLFADAGLDSEREAVSGAWGEDWQSFIDMGIEYKDATGKPFVDNVTQILNGAQTQLGTGYAYYNRNNELDMDASKPAFDVALKVIEEGLSANITPWGPEWNTGFSNGDFATLPCPAWMQANIIDSGAPEGSWDIADIPGPGGNWGGSFYTIPAQFDEYTTQEAYNFIEWLVQPDQQIAIFDETGNLPSQSSLYENEGIQAQTNPFFNDAPTGQIFSQTAMDIPGAIYYAPNNAAIRTAVETVLNEVQAGNIAIEDAWDEAVAAAEAADAA